jgi:isocitrate lyase
MMRAVGEVQDAPVIADIDTGFGNAVNVAYAVPRYAAAGVAAVVTAIGRTRRPMRKYCMAAGSIQAISAA